MVNETGTVCKELESEIRKNPTFSKIILDEPDGFLFEKIKSGSFGYDFRHIKIHNNQQFDFLTGLNGEHTKEQVVKMFNSDKS